MLQIVTRVRTAHANKASYKLAGSAIAAALAQCMLT
jgi:hypothetical protein